MKDMNSNEFIEIKPLRAWVQKVLPLVYDDSLSYYELLCKVVFKLNEVIKNVDQLPAYIAELISEDALKEIISTLLDELREQIAIANEKESETATANRTTGDLVWLDGKLYRIIHDMIAGDRYVVGSNCEKITVEEILDDLIETVNDLLDKLRDSITDKNEGDSTTATANRAVNDLVWVNYELVRIIAPMIAGDRYVEGSNCEVVTIAELIDNTELFENFKHSITFEDEGESRTATSPRSVGDVLWVNNQLVRVISPMIAGDTYVLDSNITPTSIWYYFENLLKLNNVDIAGDANIAGDINVTGDTDVNDINIDGDIKYKDPTNGEFYDTVEVNDTDGNPYNVLVENANTKNLGSRSQLMTSRAKLGWYTGAKVRAWANKFYMNGFRFMGQNYKEGTKLYKSGNLPYTLFDHDLDIDVLQAFNGHCWYALFVVPDTENEGYIKPKCIPFLRVTAMSGNTLTLGTTRMGRMYDTLSQNLLDDLSGRDVLIINASNTAINGEVAKIASNTPSSITLDGSYSVGVNSHILIAPAGDEYGYVGSAYSDSTEWKNRQDNGYMVKFLDDIARQDDNYTVNEHLQIISKNDWCPLASGIIYQMNCTLSTTATGSLAFYCGADDSHLLTEYFFEKLSATTQNAYSTLISTLFDYMQSITIEFHCTWATPINMRFRCHGWYEA